MVRKQDKPEHRKIPCYLFQGNTPKKLFYAWEQRTNNITTEIGQQMSNGFRTLRTSSTLDFTVNDQVQIYGDKKLTIRDVGMEPVEDDNNSLRGKPRYEKVLLIR